MTTATFEFVSYTPQPAPKATQALARTTRTSTPGRSWFTLDRVLHKVSTALVPLLGLGAFDTAVAAVLAEDAVQVAPQAARAKAMNTLLCELIGYQFLLPDWDGYGGRPANPHAALDALTFLHALPSELPLPSPMLAGSGMVGLYWDRGSRYVSLDFEGDGTYTFLTDDPEGYGGAEGIAAGTVPAELRRYLANLTVVG